MVRRELSKHRNPREDYRATDFTSDDVLYTTESAGVNSYETGTSKIYDSYTSDTFGGRRYETYDSGDPRAYDSYVYDDHDTSFYSYGERKRNRKYSTHESRQRSRGRHSPKRYSPTYQPSTDVYNDYTEDTGGRKRTKHGRSPERDTYSSSRYGRTTDKDIVEKKRRKDDYSNYSEGELQTLNEELDDGSGKKNRFKTTGRKKDYHVYAYQEPKHDLFRNKKGGSKTTLLSPEVDMKSYKYPVLAFKVVSPKENPLDKESDTIYLPVLEINKKTKTYKTVSYHKKSPDDTGTQKQTGNFQVYAANLNNQKNIFQVYSDDAKKNASIDNNGKKEEKSNKTFPQAQQEIKNGKTLSGSLPYSLFSDVTFNAQLTKDTSGIKDMQTDVIKMGNRKIVNYQVNVDIDKDNKGVFQDNTPKGSVRKSTVSRKSNLMAGLEFKQIDEDPLLYDFPVTKDYIKVNENTPGHNQSLTSGPISVAARKSGNLGDDGNQVSSDQNVEDNTKPVGKSKFSVLYGEPMKDPSPKQSKTSDVEVEPTGRKSRIGSAPGTRKSQIGNSSDLWQSIIQKAAQEKRKSIAAGSRSSQVANSSDLWQNIIQKAAQEKRKSIAAGSRSSQIANPSDLWQNDIPRKSTIEKRKSIAAGSRTSQIVNPADLWQNDIPRKSTVEKRKSIATGSRKSLANIVNNSSKDKLSEQENNPRLSTVGGRMSSIKVKPMTSESNINQSADEQYNRRSSRVGAPSGTRLNQSITQPNKRLSTVGGRMSSIKVKPMTSGTDINQSADEQYNRRSSRVGAPSGIRFNQSIIQPNKRQSTVGGRMNSIEVKPMTSGTDINQSAADQYNRRSSRVGAPSGTRLNQSIIQPNKRLSTVGEKPLEHQDRRSTKVDNDLKSETRLSTVGSGKTINDVNPLEQKDIWHTSTVGSGSANASQRQTLNTNEETPIAANNKINMKSITTALLNASRMGEKDRSHVPVASKKSVLGAPPNKSKASQNSRSVFVKNVEPTASLYKQNQQMSEALSAFKNPSKSRLSSVQQKSIIAASGNKSKSILSKKLRKSKSKDKSDHGKKSKWNLFGKKKATVSEEEPMLPQNDFYHMYAEMPEKNETPTEIEVQPQTCDCVAQYVIRFREWVHFFLGTTLHEQVMIILKNI